MLLPLVIALLQAPAAPKSREKPIKQTDWVCPEIATRYRCEASGLATEAKGATLTLRTDGAPLTAYQAITATIRANDVDARLIHVSAEARTTGADFGAALVLRAMHGPTALIDEQDARRSILDNSGWRHLEATLRVPAQADEIQFGIRLTGLGKVEVRRLVVEPLTTPSEVDAMAAALPPLVALRSGIGGDSATVDDAIDALRTVERAFAEIWFSATALDASQMLQRSWRKESKGDPADEVTGPQAVRGTLQAFLHCHPPPDADSMRTRPATTNPFAIAQFQFQILASVGRHAICPSWLLTESNGRLGDERLNADTAIAPAARAQVREERAAVIAALNRAVARFPANDWIVGQRVRFLVDQHDTLGAVSAVNRCGASSWWCALLGGYVLHWQGKIREADTVFVTAVPRAPLSVRCEMTDLHGLLPPEAQSPYRAIPCAKRDSLNARIWWLADPLYTEPGNERRSEHYARLVEMRLRSAVDENDPFDWSEEFGGSAVRQMFLRYGAPAARMWFNTREDGGHQGFLETSRPNHFTSNEYTLDRYHALPTWSAVEQPMSAKATDWELTVDAFARSKADERLWWPREHFARGRDPLMQLFEQQSAMFSRDSGALLAVAIDPSATHPVGVDRSAAAGTLVLTTAPDSFRFVPLAAGEGTTMQVQTLVPYGRPQLMGLELALDAPKLAIARTRFGITAPPTLVLATPTAIAISDIALLAPDDAAGWSPDPVIALKRMFGTTSLGDVKKLGIYWESYGIRPTDSLTLSIRIDNLDPPSALRRLGQALRIAGRTERTVTVSWKVPRAGDNAALIPGRVITLGQVAPIDVSSLEPGHYRLTLTVNRVGTPAVSTVRELMIRG